MGAGLAGPVETIDTFNEFRKHVRWISATQSVPEFELDSRILLMRAQEVDKIKVYGLPYYESLIRRLQMTEHEIFNYWFNLAKTVLSDADVELMFASTLVMDGKVVVMEREEMGVNSTDMPSFFGQWAARNLDKVKLNLNSIPLSSSTGGRDVDMIVLD